MNIYSKCKQQFSETGIEAVDYTETEHWRTIKQFVNAPDKMLNYLLGAEMGNIT
jgi:predicted ATPase